MRVQDHMVVSFTYVIVDEAGRVLEQSDIPIAYVHGVDERLFSKLMQAMAGRRVDDEVEVTLSPEEGFGQPDPQLIVVEEIENVPPEYRYVGAEAAFENERGGSMTMRVTRIADGKLTLDANHPFAGKSITYKLRICALRPATAEEVGRGEPLGGPDLGGLH